MTLTEEVQALTAQLGSLTSAQETQAEQQTQLQEQVKALLAGQQQLLAALAQQSGSENQSAARAPTARTPPVLPASEDLLQVDDEDLSFRQHLPDSALQGRRSQHWRDFSNCAICQLPPATTDRLPFEYRTVTCVDGGKLVPVLLPVVTCAAELEPFAPYQLGDAAVKGVPRASPPASTDRRHLQALTHLQKDSQPKAFELQHLGSALGWEHAIIAGARSVLAAREELPAKVVHEQLELAFEALELNYSHQLQRLRYLGLPGDDQLADPALRSVVVAQVGDRQRRALHCPSLTTPTDVDLLAFTLANDLATELGKQRIKVYAKAKHSEA